MVTDSSQDGYTREAIRDLRQRAGMTQDAFAHSLGVTWSAVARWEAGSRRPVGLSLLALANFDRWLTEQVR